ncbi:MAG: bifunctional demethylmenaquinone methyltransferase/2-methoxy-6-polyprenyl-1,4-benzoquinol methylase UbiE [Alphaproteobacteria bacterium]
MTNPSADAAKTASFGARQVPVEDKQQLVDEVFDQVAGNYDLMNDLMSAGAHRLWKDAFVAWLGPPRRGAQAFRILDLAGGTGDIALRIADVSPRAEIVVGDINPAMLDVGRARAGAAGLQERVVFEEANAEELAFADERFDAVTIAFGIRNVPRIEQALGEMLRVLKPGGRFMCLEFSTVDVALLDRLYEFLSFNVIPQLGSMVVGDAAPYQYLVESIRRFPNQARFAAMIEAAGFERVTFRNLTGGIAAMHSGWKI